MNIKTGHTMPAAIALVLSRGVLRVWTSIDGSGETLLVETTDELDDDVVLRSKAVAELAVLALRVDVMAGGDVEDVAGGDDEDVGDTAVPT